MKKILQTFLILIAFGIEAKSQTMLTIAQVYDFNINDEFQYRYYDLDYNNYGSFPNRTRYKIVNKYFSALNDTVFYIRLFYKKDTVECGERDTTGISVNIIENNSENSYNKIFVYPNPTTNNLTIQAPQNSTSDSYRIEITNIEGQIIKTFINNNIETTIDVSDLSPGVYIIKAQTEKGVVIKKFIKQ